VSLFNDSDFVSSADMLSLDPEITVVSRAEGIPIDANGIAAQACGETADKIMNDTQAFTGFMPPFALPYNQTAAVLNLVGPSVNRSRLSMTQVVVSNANPSETSIAKASPLKRYTVYRALELFFRAAYNRKLTDRYEKKMTYYSEEIRKKYWPRFYNLGAPIVFRPLVCPGALHEWNAGVWDATRVSGVTGTNANVDTDYHVAITWVDNTKYVSPTLKGNAESAPSARQDIRILQNNVLAIDITPLNAPDGTNPLNVALGQGLITPGKASGWNVYVGPQGGTLYLQNATPIAIATKTYTLTGAPVLSGYQADTGQFPDANLTLQHTVMRG